MIDRILVTGSLGFIGSKIAVFLFKKGYTIQGWDLENANGLFPTYAVNLLDESNVVNMLSLFQPDIVIHCAGLANVWESIQKPKLDFECNVSSTHNLLFGIHKAGLNNSRFVFLSSASVYGNPSSLPITENMRLNPLSPYAMHKVMCEEMCNYFSFNYKMDVRIARIFSAYGEGLKKQMFWDMYQKFCSTGELKLIGTGNESRDYIHINDLVQALTLIATKDSCPSVINVANGNEVMIRLAAELFAKCVNLDLKKISFNGINREGDPLNLRADISNLKSIGYYQTIKLSDGIQSYIEWAEKQKEI